MHPYAIFDHKRQIVGRILGVLSFIIAPVVSGYLLNIRSVEGLSGFVITSGVLYIMLHWVFDNIVWKWPLIGRALSIPNYSGMWDVEGQTIDENGEVKFDWGAVIEVVQKWDSISVQLKTGQSESYSYTVTTLKLPNGCWQLSYSYSNQPNLNQLQDLSAHRGFCELVFDLKKGEARGTYFNSMGRRTNGNMMLQRNEEQ
jgi:hypothetical protein